MNCKTCKFYTPTASGSFQCRRFPPMPILQPGTRDEFVTRWPRVKEEHWCGEYQPRAGRTPTKVVEE